MRLVFQEPAKGGDFAKTKTFCTQESRVVAMTEDHLHLDCKIDFDDIY